MKDMNNLIITALTIIVPVGISVYLFWELSKLKKRFEKLTSGVTESNLEEIVAEYVKHLKKVHQDNDHITAEFENIRKETADFFRKRGLVRFQAFKDTGGDQSFSLVLLDEKNNGFILSCLHGRGFSKIFAKEVTNGASPNHKLTEEEEAALKEAMSK